MLHDSVFAWLVCGGPQTRGKTCAPGADGKSVFMTLQTIAGSDYFGPVHWMTSRDLGKTWTEPQPVPPMSRVKQGNGPTEEGVCDVVPEWHPPTKSVLAFGHNVFYSGPKFSTDQPPRWPIYAVWRDGKWGPRRKLEWADPRGAQIYSNNCGQRVGLPNGDIQMSFTFGATKGEARAVAGVICGFDGEQLTVKHMGHRRRDAPQARLQGRLAPRTHPVGEAEQAGDHAVVVSDFSTENGSAI